MQYDGLEFLRAGFRPGCSSGACCTSMSVLLKGVVVQIQRAKEAQLILRSMCNFSHGCTARQSTLNCSQKGPIFARIRERF